VHNRSTPRVVVIGAGPTGIGAAHRLRERGLDDYVVLEASDDVGGLGRSFVDGAGFTHDVGGHVLFSHYPYYDRVVDAALADGYTEIDRDAWVWTEGRFVRYPFQHSIKDLPPSTALECVMGLIEAERQPPSAPTNFAEWMEQTFGAGITKHFMRPYNFKVWATPAELMGFGWIAERVSPVDAESVLRSIIYDEAPRPWGPNDRFRYPLRGGTGALWANVARPVLDHVELRRAVVGVDPSERVVHTADGRHEPYDLLLNSTPLHRLVASTEGVPDAVRGAAAALEWSGSHIVGVGLDRPAGTAKNWIYFPEPAVPFYRVTYLSNYSPFMTPAPDQTLLLAEISRSRYKLTDSETVVDEVIDGLIQAGLMTEADRGVVVSRWLHSPDTTYPVPTIGRDAALATIQPWLGAHDIWSRGRFGAWLYEIGNMDHSFMQGVEWVDHVLDGAAETTWESATPAR